MAALDAASIAGLAGRSYAEVAVDIIGRFTGNSVSQADLARMTREAYGNFRHPAVAPLTQLGANTFLLELFPRADAGLQRFGDAIFGVV